MALQSLHLKPLSRADQRCWSIGSEPPSPPDGRGIVELDVRPDCHETFSSLRSILCQLAPLAGTDQAMELQRLEHYLREACPAEGIQGTVTHGQLLADGVAFAVMRRISRESMYTAPIIDLAARLLNSIFSGLDGCREVRVRHIDRLDRPTLKVLARAMILLSPEDSFRWHWHSASDPTASGEEGDDTYLASRRLLLQRLVGLVEPGLQRCNGALPLRRPGRREGRRTAYEISAALVLQNYDACFLWCEDLLDDSDSWSAAEGLRLKSLAAINVGFHDEASAVLHHAEALLDKPGRKAHLSYLQGLLEAKRCYDLSRSDYHYARGLEALESASPAQEDIPLERGWLLNGLALNRAISWRRHPERSELFNEAFELEHRAFELVKQGHGPARNYLRFNLIANSAFLMEMKGEFQTSIDVFTKAFDFEPLAALPVRDSLRKTLVYRIGVLHYRDGRLEDSHRLLREIAGEETGAEQWALQERILRSLGTVELDRHAFEDARDAFARGLSLCRQARSAEGTREHARGLILALHKTGRSEEAELVYEEITRGEGVDLTSGAAPERARPSRTVQPSRPSPKLPAYFPEIDLEEIPAIDLNRFLAHTLPRGQSASPWRS